MIGEAGARGISCGEPGTNSNENIFKYSQCNRSRVYNFCSDEYNLRVFKGR